MRVVTAGPKDGIDPVRRRLVIEVTVIEQQRFNRIPAPNRAQNNSIIPFGQSWTLDEDSQ